MDPTAALYDPQWAVPPALPVTWQQDAHSSGEEFTLVSPSVPRKLWLALQDVSRAGHCRGEPELLLK